MILFVIYFLPLLLSLFLAVGTMIHDYKTGVSKFHISDLLLVVLSLVPVFNWYWLLVICQHIWEKR